MKQKAHKYTYKIIETNNLLSELYYGRPKWKTYFSIFSIYITKRKNGISNKGISIFLFN